VKTLRLVVVIGALALSSHCVGAQEEAACEHAKINTEDATTLDPGVWELELALGLAKSRRAFNDHWGADRRLYLREETLGLGLTYGLRQDLNVGLGFGYASVYDRDCDDRTVRGWTDIEVGAKWRFYHDEARRLEIAYVPAIIFPTGSAGMTDDFVSVFNGVAISKDWTSRLTSNFDLGYGFPVGGHRQEYQGTLSADAALGYHVTDWLQPEIELNYFHDFNHGNDADLLAATVGAIICLREDVRLDVGVQQGLTGRNADKGTAFMASLTFAF
jgi:hypothetical protein